jgi:hypothetical protein
MAFAAHVVTESNERQQALEKSTQTVALTQGSPLSGCSATRQRRGKGDNTIANASLHIELPVYPESCGHQRLSFVSLSP